MKSFSLKRAIELHHGISISTYVLIHICLLSIVWLVYGSISITIVEPTHLISLSIIEILYLIFITFLTKTKSANNQSE